MKSGDLKLTSRNGLRGRGGTTTTTFAFWQHGSRTERSNIDRTKNTRLWLLWNRDFATDQVKPRGPDYQE